ncbi:MAG: caspase family protein [Spirochaetales bacterium]|nr:caspase family protein [Spirochaetales bacterium]
MYNTRTGEEKFKIEFPDSFIHIIACSPNNDFFAFQEDYDKISIYDLTTGHYVKGFEYFFAPGLIHLDVSPNGKNFASGSDCSHNVKIWNIETGTLVNELEGHTDTILSITYSPDGRYIASGSRDGTVRLWCALTGKEIKKFFGHKYGTVVSAFSTNGKFLFADPFSSNDGETSKIWDIETGKEVVVDGLGCFLGYNESKSLCCFRGENSTVRIYDTLTGKIVSILRGHADFVDSVSYSPDDKYVATSDGEAIRIWEIKTGREIKKLNTCTWVKGFSLDGNYIIGQYFDGDYMKWNLKTGKIMTAPSSDIEKFSYNICYASNKRNIISSDYKSGKIRILDAETNSLIYTILHGKDYDYLTYTPEGFFTGTEWAMKNLVHIVDGMDVIGIDQVYDKLYRPDLVAAKMRGEDISEYAKEVNLASIVRSGNAPAVAIENLLELSSSRDVTFDICVQNTGGGIGNVSIVLNGKTIRLSEGIASSNGEQKIFRHTVTLQNGQNKIEAFAMNSAGMIESRRASADVSWQGKTSKPNLYVLTVAVNKYRDKDLWLNYCVPDATSIEESFKKQQSGLYQDVCVYSLKDAEVTKEGLEQKFKELSSIVTADDVFVFFVSGHGTAYDDGDYYFIPVNFRYTNKTDIPLKAISKSDLTKNLSLIKAGKTLMMLDTCNSGAFFADSNKRGMGDKGIFERLSRATGHAILAAASDSQSAMEGYNGHGVFTYVLLDGLAGNADSNNDGFVSLTELSSYVENQVPELSYEQGKRM